MNLNSDWYEYVAASTPLTQGDLIMDCPVFEWSIVPPPVENPSHDDHEWLKEIIKIGKKDLVVMTQACDLEQGKAKEVVLCPHYDVGFYRDEVFVPAVHAARREKYATGNGKKRDGEKLKIDAGLYKSFCGSIVKGTAWNLFMLGPAKLGAHSINHRIVDFLSIHTIPKCFLESIAAGSPNGRLRLVAPYREHLSQAFARSYMRVGLPNGIAALNPEDLVIATEIDP